MQGPVNIQGLRSAHTLLLQQIVNAVDTSLDRAGDYAEHVVATESGFKHSTGALARKTEHRVIRKRNGAVLVLRNPSKYALAQDQGSGTHAGRGKYPIRPRRGKALRFVGRNGAVMYRRLVMHPGVPATKFLWRAAVKAGGREKYLLEIQMGRISKRFNKLRV